MKRNKNNSLFDPVLLRRSLRASFTKLDPRQMIKNPIMFTVEAVTFAMLLLIVRIAVTGDTSQGSLLYNLVIFAVLLLTVLFANFAEAIAEARGRAQADSLRKTREETPAKRIEPDGQSHIVSSSELKQGDLFECVAGDTVAADGEIVEGLASIDESAITGESAPVIREAGGDKSSVTGGTKVLSDRILVKVTARPGESFLDRMIALVEGSSRQKTPNEIALTILLAGFTLVFVIVCATLKPFADYVGANITVAAFISLFVCLIPTTIGGLLSAIGIAGMVGIALILREAMRLQYDGTLDVRRAVGLPGTVYLTIPACRAAPGKVNITVQEQLRELEAFTDSDTPIPTGSPVRVTGLLEGGALLVERSETEASTQDNHY